MAINRKVLRKKFAQLVEAALVNGATQLAARVYDYNVSDFGNNSPVVVVKSGGSNRPRLTARGGGLTAFLEVVVWVRYNLTAAENSGEAWSEEDSEDRLDDIEAAIAKVVEDNVQYFDSGQERTPYWDVLEYEDTTTVGSITVEELGGRKFRVEVIRLKAEVYRNEN